MVDQDRRPFPSDIDPERADQGNKILDSLQLESEIFLQKQRVLGAQMGKVLADAIVQMEMLDLVPQIRAFDAGLEEDDAVLSVGFTVLNDNEELEDPFGEFGDEEDEEEEILDPEVINIPGFWVIHKDIDGEEELEGVFLDREGKLWIDNQFGESGVDTDTFYIGDAEEVPIEDYPKYFNYAILALKEATEVGLGVAEEKNKLLIKEGIEINKAKINRDNEIYGGVEDFDNLTATALMKMINEMRGNVANSSDGLNSDQLENLLMRLFEAQELMQNGGLEEQRGGEELNLLAGSFILNIDSGLAHRINDLVNIVFNSDDRGSYLLRRSFRVPYQEEPENREILRVLALSNRRLGYFGVINRGLMTPDDFVTEDGRVIAADEIRDWLLSPPKTLKN